MGQYRANIADTVLAQYPQIWPKVLAPLWKVIRLHPGQHWPNTFLTLDQCCKAIIENLTVLDEYGPNNGAASHFKMCASTGPVHCPYTAP